MKIDANPVSITPTRTRGGRFAKKAAGLICVCMLMYGCVQVCVFVCACTHLCFRKISTVCMARSLCHQRCMSTSCAGCCSGTHRQATVSTNAVGRQLYQRMQVERQRCQHGCHRQAQKTCSNQGRAASRTSAMYWFSSGCRDI